jgi:UDP-glucose 4-epimerase
MNAIMITGGQGFIGRHITQRLTAAGRRVISYNRDFATDEEGAHMVQGELFDVPRLVRVIKERRIEQIVHTAAMSHPTLSLDFPIATFAANVEGTLSLLEAARLADVGRVVNFSSEAVYGATAGPLTEEVPVKPSTPYAVTKVTAEWLGKVYSNRYALDVVSLRIGQAYGPGNRMPEVLGDMLKALTKTGVFTLAQGSDQLLQLHPRPRRCTRHGTGARRTGTIRASRLQHFEWRVLAARRRGRPRPANVPFRAPADRTGTGRRARPPRSVRRHGGAARPRL